MRTRSHHITSVHCVVLLSPAAAAGIEADFAAVVATAFAAAGTATATTTAAAATGKIS
jgi:hypothetical protein